MENKDEQFMQRALDEARQALREGEIPIGAVVVCKDRIIARAHNLTETLCDVTAHAEMQAITAAANQLGGKYLTDCTLSPWSLAPCVPVPLAGHSFPALSMAVPTRNGASTRMPHMPCTPRQQ